MAEINYLDFDLLIERAEGGYRAQVLNSPAGQATADFTLPFSDLELENFFLRVGQTRRAVRRIESPEAEAAKTFGGRLFNAVFASDVRGCLRSSLDEAERQSAGLRVRLRLSDAPELLDLPWEYLYNQTLNRFMALSVETPLVRYLDLPERIQPLAVRPPLKMLVMISSPSDYPPLDVEREWAKLNEALGDLMRRGRVLLRRSEAATLTALQRQLRREDFHIFHFVGHGGFDQQAQDGVLLMETEEKRGRPVGGSDLGMLLHDERTVRLAVLNACEGARASRTDPFAGTAQSLVQQGIPVVIGMQFEISDVAAITFSREFYSAVADGYPVDAAMAEARKAIFAEGNVVEWGTPVLYLRAPDGRIFDIEPLSEAEREPAQTAALLREAQTAIASEDWTVAIEKLQALLALEPTHVEGAVLLDQAQRQQKLATLYATGREHCDAGRWREALDCFRQVKIAGGSYRDVDTLVASVQGELAKSQAAPARPAPAQHPPVSGGTKWMWIAGGIGALAMLACVVLVGALALPTIFARTPTPVTGTISPAPALPTSGIIVVTPSSSSPTWIPTPTPATQRPTSAPTPRWTFTPNPTPTPPKHYALQFDGIDDFVSIPANGKFDLGASFTVEAWIKPQSLAGSGTFKGIVQGAFSEPPSKGGAWVMYLDRSDYSTWGLSVCTPGCNSAKSRSLQAGQWQHLAATYDGTKITLYRNGVLAASAPQAGNMKGINFVLVGIWDTSFNGMIDEIRIWSTARTQSDIQSNMNRNLGGSEPGLAGYWRLDEGSGQAASDLTRNHNDGRLGSSRDVDSNDPAWVASDVPVR